MYIREIGNSVYTVYTPNFGATQKNRNQKKKKTSHFFDFAPISPKSRNQNQKKKKRLTFSILLKIPQNHDFSSQIQKILYIPLLEPEKIVYNYTPPKSSKIVYIRDTVYTPKSLKIVYIPTPVYTVYTVYTETLRR